MSEARPSVAIITRTKDRSLLLVRAMRSILSQTISDWKMVIVNDGGSREEVDALAAAHAEEFQGRLLVLHNEKSMGMEAASNLGIRSCDSDFVVIHDDDDTWHGDFLSECVSFFQQNPSAFGVITHSMLIHEEIEDNSVREISREPFNGHLQNMIPLFSLYSRNLFPPISFMYRRSALDGIGYYDERLPVLGDWEFNLRFLAHYDIHIVPKLLANWHQRPSISSGSLGNTVVAQLATHHAIECGIRNEMIRRDIEGKEFGAGMVMHFSRAIADLDARLASYEARLDRVDFSISQIPRPRFMRYIKKKIFGK
jgi:hypothetical protein